MKHLFFLAILIPASLFSQEKFEVPKKDKRHNIIEHENITISYFNPFGQAAWVAYELTKEEINGSISSEKKKITADPKFEKATSSVKDYKGSDMLMGHIAPIKDMSFSEQSLNECFYITNITPMKAGFVNGVWTNIEELIRYWAKEYGSVYIVSGPVLTDPPYKTIGKNKISVPKHFYKVVMTGDKSQALGFVVSNRNTTTGLYSLAKSVNEVEELTGIDFFPSMNDEAEESVESKYDKHQWIWEIPK